MADNTIELIARIKTDDSEELIKEDIKTMSKDLQDNPLKISCVISDDSINAIKAQLGGLDDFVLNIGGIKIDDSMVNMEVSQAVSNIQNSMDRLSTIAKIDLSTDNNALGNFIDKLTELNVRNVNIEEFENRLKSLHLTIEKITPEFVRLEEGGEQILSSFAISGRDENNNLVSFVEKFNSKTGEFTKATTKITTDLSKVEKAQIKAKNETEAYQKVFNEFLTLQGKYELYGKQFGEDTSLSKQFQDISGIMEEFSNTDPIEKQREVLIRLDTALKLIKVDIDKINQAKNNTVSSDNSFYPVINKVTSESKSSNAAQLNEAKTTLNDFFKSKEIDDSATRIKRAVEDSSGALQRFYVQIEKGDKSVETLTYALNEQGTAYEYLGKVVREADNSTDFRRRGINVQWDLQAEAVKKFAANVERADYSTDELADDIKKLQNLLKVRGDTNAMNQFLDTFDLAKAKHQALSAEVRKNNFATAYSNRIKKLVADMNSYAVANQRAVESTKRMSDGVTFADKWANMMSRAADKVNLSDSELKRLNQELAIFRKEAEAAGLKGESAFGKFLNSFKTMSSYISANMVFNFVKRQIRELVNEITELDTAMVELRKVTVATDEDFREYEKTAASIAKEVGASITDVINATSTFARLGENLEDATALGRIATIYQNVGDGITEAQASEDLVSVMKAFNIQAQDAITVVDKLNEVGNNFAITSGGIGEALKRSASALATANNSLSESIALITTANTIAQNPEAVGTGMKTMALRLRSTKTELEEMGEDAEGAAENVSKLRQQMLALTGVDIQLDDTTFKSSYQILLEISKVWGRLDDLSRASVLEQLFGKRQANIGAAILENGKLLERVYQTSEASAGSAMREQAEYAKSIQYSIDNLKAAYQEFAKEVISSDSVKSILKIAQTFLETLTGIVDIFGTLPPILATISTVMGVKGHGIFPTEGLTSFKDGLESIKASFQTLRSYGSIKELYSANNINLVGLSKDDIAALQKYVDILKSGNKENISLEIAMDGTSKSAQKQAEKFRALNDMLRTGEISQEQYEAATLSLSTAQKAATISSKALSVALNALGNIAIMSAITLITKGISALVDKLVVTEEELAQVRDKTVQDLQKMSSELSDIIKKEEDIQELVGRYKQLILSTQDISANKDELIKIQDSLIEKFQNERAEIDLLNDSYDETIKKIKELSDEEYSKWASENADKLAKAEKLAGYNVAYRDMFTDRYGVVNYSEMNKYDQVFYKGQIQNEDKLAASLYKVKNVSKEVRKYIDEINGASIAEGLRKDDLYLSGRLEDAYDQLDRLIKLLRENNADENVLAPLSAQLIKIGDAIEYTDKYMQQKRLHEAEYVETLNNTTTKAIYLLQLEGEAADESRAKWFNNYKTIQEGFDKTVDPIIKSIQSIADGDALSSEDFWKIMEIDTNHIISDIKMVGDQFVLNQDQLIALKDQYIQSQVASIELQNEELENQKTQLINTIAQAEAELSILGARGMAVEAYRTEFAQAQNAIRNAKGLLVELENQQKRNNLLVEEFNSKLGDTANYLNRLKEEVEQLTNDLDDYVKAYEYRIDRIIDNLEDEVDVLNEQKSALQEELDVLNEQRDAIQETIDNYKTVADLVQDVVDKRKEELEAEKKAIEDTYNERINKLKEETEQREDAFEYAQKLANLENAKNNKRRVYDEARGWRYESVKEDVVKAENDLAKFENEQAIKSLEKERDELTKTIDEQIEEQTRYAQFYKDTIDEIIIKENELLAEQILGSKWREDIANLDIETAEKFRTEYRNHNAALQNITRTEIKLKEEAIKAKDAEIKAKQEQIDSWKKYKTNVQDAVKDIKTAQEGYMSVVRELDETEPLTLENRGRAFDTFKTKVTGAIETITAKQGEVDRLTSSFDGLTGDYGISFSIAGVDQLQQATELAERLAVATSLANGTFHANNISDIVKAMGLGYTDADLVNSWIKELIQGEHAKGGVADYTGLAMLHGTKQKSETIFNANDSAKLYDMVHNTPNLMADMLNQATKLSGFKLSSNENTNNSSVSIGAINVYANNPTELTQGLDKTLDRYFRTKLTQSYTSKQ